MLHILAGLYKGRKLLAPPPSASARPMTGMVKKSLFDIISTRLDQAVVLDLYCGTGTLGLEALSRGARWCFFADRDRLVLERLRRNIVTIGLQDQCTVWQGDIDRRLDKWLAGLIEPIDVVFIDPPFTTARGWEPSQIADLLSRLADRLSDDGLVTLRLPAGPVPPSQAQGLILSRTSRYGGMLIAFYSPHRPAGGQTAGEI